MTSLAKAAFLGLVEGATEFLPVSSTAHLVLAARWLSFPDDTFLVVVQIGAILAVVVFERERIRRLLLPSGAAGGAFAGLRGIVLLAATTLPALVAGALFHGPIKARLFAPVPVAAALAAGGAAILGVEAYFARAGRARGPGRDLDALDLPAAFGIGLFQCLALWPGVSRAAATILGGMLLGLSRRAATEYSFLAAIPVLVAAAAYDLWKGWDALGPGALSVYAAGLAVAFLSGLAALRLFLGWVKTRTLAPFGWYRIALGAAVLGAWG